jgi:hypothetical protein
MAVEVPEKESPDHVDMIQEAVESDHPEVEETPFNSMQFVGTIIAAGFGMIGVSPRQQTAVCALTCADL